MKLDKKFKFRVGLDVDDVLLPCTILAVQMANRDFDFEPPLTINEITSWNGNGGRGDVIYDYFNEREFYEAQSPLVGAQEFVRKLSKKAEIFIVTAIDSRFMDVRFKQIEKFFPEIKKENIIPAYRKDVIDLDFLLDDGAHNLLASKAKYPVLFRRPWNGHITGRLAVNNYDEFLNLFESIKNSYLETNMSFRQPTVLALVGPSGSGKTAITEKIIENQLFEKPVSATTRAPRAGEDDNSYHFITEDEFLSLMEAKMFAESSVYAGNRYGVELASINKILSNGKHCVLPIDISGAIALKMQFKTCIIYVDRERPALIDALSQRLLDNKMTKDDFVHRIVSLTDEKQNEAVCDYTLHNNGTLDDAVNQILETMKIGK